MFTSNTGSIFISRMLWDDRVSDLSKVSDGSKQETFQSNPINILNFMGSHKGRMRSK